VKEVSFASKTGNYIRLRSLAETNGNPWTSVAEIALLGQAKKTTGVLPQETWSLQYVDSQELTGEDGAAENAFDGDPNTFWHTQWYQVTPNHPHEIQINLGGLFEIDGFLYQPRQDGGINGWIKQYELYVSADGINWGIPVVTGTFSSDNNEKQVSFVPTIASYIRVRALSEANGNPWTSMAEIRLIGKELESAPQLSRSSWKLKYVDSQELLGENGAAKNAFDNDPKTFWHTQWYQASPKHPHEIQIDLGGLHEIQGFRYLPRQDGGVNGRIKQYELYISTDGVNWGTPVATGELINDSTEKQVYFASKLGNYVRLRSLAEVSGNPWTSMAEFNLLGR